MFYNTDSLLHTIQQNITQGMGEEAAFLSALAQYNSQMQSELNSFYQQDASIFDGDLTVFPMEPFPTIVRVMRHVVALSGFTPQEIDDIFRYSQGTTQQVMQGDVNSTLTHIPQAFIFFVNFNRYLNTVLGNSVSTREWWLTAGPRKRLVPLDYIRRGTITSEGFDVYRHEIISQNNLVIPTLRPSLNSPQWTDF